MAYKMSEIEDLMLDKLKLLYEYQFKQFDHAKAQSARLDDKASKYLTFASLLVAILSIIAKSYIVETETLKFWSFSTCVVALIFFSFIQISLVIRHLFACMKITKVAKLSSDKAMQSYFKTNDISVIYDGLSEDLGESINKYENSNEEKVKELETAYSHMVQGGYILILLMIFIIFDVIAKYV